MVKIMKNLLVLLVLVIFAASVAQMALAEEDSALTTTGEKVVSAKEVKKADIQKVKEERVKVKELKEEKIKLKEAIKVGELEKKDVKEKVKVLKEESKKEREVVQKAMEKFKESTEVLKKAREEYGVTKENYKVKREEHSKERVDLLRWRKESKECKGEDVECKNKKDEVKKGTRLHLIKTADLIRESFAKLKVKVQNSDTLTEEEKTAALDSIAQQEELLNAQKAKVEALADTATNEELKAAVKDLKNAWEEAKKVQKKLIAELINSKVDNLVKKHSEYGNALQMRIDNLKAKGVDVTELEALQVKFKEAQATLEIDQAAALEQWKQAQSKEAALDTWKEAQKIVREDMEKTKEILREFLAKYKELNKGSQEETETITETTSATETTPVTETIITETTSATEEQTAATTS